MSEPPAIPPALSYAQAPSAVEPKFQRLAVRSLRALGLLCSLFGFGGGALAGIMYASGDIPHRRGSLPVLILLGFIGIAGIIYLICSAKVRSGSRVAGVVAIAVAAAQEGLALLTLLSTSLLILRTGNVNFMGLGTNVFIVLAFAQLLYHLVRFLRPVEPIHKNP